jgi:hypothetical protein
MGTKQASTPVEYVWLSLHDVHNMAHAFFSAHEVLHNTLIYATQC